jgi:hypothetical protein
LTQGDWIDIFRGFREYPERAVIKRLGDRLKKKLSLYRIQEMFRRIQPDCGI